MINCRKNKKNLKCGLSDYGIFEYEFFGGNKGNKNVKPVTLYLLNLYGTKISFVLFVISTKNYWTAVRHFFKFSL